VAIVILVLLLTSHAWLEPVVILFVLAVSIVINMGTNFVFPDVSFVTFAVSAILQLALSIDYAIMLLHTYNAFCDQGMGPEEAMTEALAQCFMRIASSAMTTVAGLLSLLFMSFTIGFDIGMVLSKGIVISMLCVLLLMPGAALLLKKPLMATRHRPIRLGGEHLGRWIWRMRWPIAIVLTAAVAGGAYLNARNTFSFTDTGATDGTENSRISEVFGASNPLVLMVPSEGKDSDYDRQRALVSDLEALKGADGAPLVSGIASMVTTGAAALEYYTVDDVAQMTGQSRLRITLFFFLNGFGQRARADRLLAVAGGLFGDNPDLAGMKALLETAQGAFTGPHYARLLVEPAFESRAEDFTDNIEAVLSAVRASYGDTFYVTGSPMSAYDVGEAFNSDLMKVNLITLAAILLIVILSFRAVGLPLLLVLVIEGAIWITMGISTLIGESIFFISYLICLSIQMGATIDYGILLSDQYRTLRREGLAPREALTEALKKALPTILTSGIILISAGFVIGRYCTIYYISSIGLLVSRGALVSVVLVLTLLPALLSLADRWIIRVNVPPDPGTDGPRT
ncbi:MAG: MMPL family transporter, partial [Lachnospiraceae bacterium]|nr:MMPL family transporter [Lachnospiraceae bacterium]